MAIYIKSIDDIAKIENEFMRKRVQKEWDELFSGTEDFTLHDISICSSKAEWENKNAHIVVFQHDRVYEDFLDGVEGRDFELDDLQIMFEGYYGLYDFEAFKFTENNESQAFYVFCNTYGNYGRSFYIEANCLYPFIERSKRIKDVMEKIKFQEEDFLPDWR